MKITAIAEDLATAADMVCPLARGKSVTPALSNVLVDASSLDQPVTLRAMNGETIMDVTLAGVKATKAGRFLIPGDEFGKCVSTVHKSIEVSLENTGGWTELRAGKSKWKLAAPLADDYPDPSFGPAVLEIETTSKIVDALSSLTYALPTKDHRRALMGVNLKFDFTEKKVEITATDGKKLARRQFSVERIDKMPELGDSEPPKSIVVTRGFIDAVLRCAPKKDVPVILRVGVRHVEMEINGSLVQSAAIEGKYPNCDAVIPKQMLYKLKFSPADMGKSLKRVSVTTHNDAVVLSLDPGGWCGINAVSQSVGSSEDTFAADWDGPAMEVGMNGKFLNETLSQIGEAETTMNVRKEDLPVTFAADEDPALYLLMPIKLKDARPANAEEEEAGEE